MSALELTRRGFLGVVGAGSAALILGWKHVEPDESNAPEAMADWEPNAFIRIDDQSIVTVTIPRSEMGQGIRTTLAMIVAEELDADWTKVRVVNAPGNPAKYGGQGTGGSGSVRGTFTMLRQAGATARAMILSAASARLGIPAEKLRTEKGVIYGDTNAALGYGTLVAEAAKLPVPERVPLKERSKFTILGKPTKRIDTPDIVTGKAVYAQDVKVEGAAYAVIARSPRYGAEVAKLDDAAARKVPGVMDIVRVPSGIAVVAANTWAALQGREALEVEWTEGPHAKLDTAELQRRLKATLVPFPTDLPADAKVVRATYEFPYLAHATMETMNAVADVREDRAQIWAPTQGPDSARDGTRRRLNLPADAVTVNMTLLGGGFGRRIAQDYVNDAVDVSKAAKRPVKVLYSRDDDMRNDFYRPMALQSLMGAIDSTGKPIVWLQQQIETRGSTRMGGFNPTRMPYNIPDIRLASGTAESPVPTGFWRSVQHTHTIPAMECFIDELAAAANQDPVAFRRAHLNNPRLRRCLDVVVERSGWGKTLPKGEALGVAVFSGYGAAIAHVVHVAIADGAIKVKRVWAAVECGLAINPLGIEAQIEGACCDAIATALHAEITVKDGAIEQRSFGDYEWMRFEETPEFDIQILDSELEPGGMGEVGYPSVLPAIAGAVWAITGKRVRKWPIRLDELA